MQRTEREKMLAGEAYDAWDAELVAARERAHDLCARYNVTRDAEREARGRLLGELLGSGGESAYVQPPFQCDYGAHIHLGTQVYFNFGCIVLDICTVRIGDRTLFGPGVQILAALHPLEAVARRTQELGKPITIGRDVWVGGGALILAGVTIGDRTVIGAGSVVTRDIPADVLAVGNPCRVVRALP